MLLIGPAYSYAWTDTIPNQSAEWLMLTFSIGNNNISIYENGTDTTIFQAGNDNYMADVFTYFRIGIGNSPTRSTNGIYDEFYIWNRALSNSEVNELYNYTINGENYPFACYTDWIDNSTECNGLNYTIIYYDNSNCNTLENLPISNGSIVSCSLENWERVTKPCNYGTRLIEYYDTLNSNLTYYLPVNNNTYENCTLESTITFNSKSVIFTLTELDLLYYIIIGILIYFPFYMNNKKYFALYIFVGIILGIYTIYLESKLLDIFIENTFFVNLIKWILLSISLSFFAYGILQGWSNLMDMIFGEKDSKGMRKK
jgi:hypothetical protein